MPEIPNVISGEIVESDWGNDIRDRTIQRYASAAARSAAHTAPVAGDLSFLTDTGIVYVYYSGSWRRFEPASHASSHAPGAADALADHGSTHEFGGGDTIPVTEVDSAGTDASEPLTGTLAAKLVTALVIPATWGAWKAHAIATGMYLVNGGVVNINIRIDGTDLASTHYNSTPDGNNMPWTVQGRSTGNTTTGSRNVNLMANAVGSGAGAVLQDMYLYARAIRTS